MGVPRLNSLGYGVTYLLVSRKTKALHSVIPKFNLLYFGISFCMVLVWYRVFSQAFCKTFGIHGPPKAFGAHGPPEAFGTHGPPKAFGTHGPF